MEIRAVDADKLKPFRISGSEPPVQVVVAAHVLLGDEKPKSALPEAGHDEDGSKARFNVFAVTTTRLIVVQGEGSYEWSRHRDQEMTSLTARTWHLNEIRSIEIKDFTLKRLGQGTIYARHRLVVHVHGEEPITMPEFAIRDDEPHEVFQRALIAAWSATVDETI